MALTFVADGREREPSGVAIATSSICLPPAPGIGELKLIHFYEDDRNSLFDLSKDIGERNDLSNKMPSETKQLSERLGNYLVEIKAQLPTKNSEFDPSQPIAPRKGGKGGNAKKGNEKK